MSKELIVAKFGSDTVVSDVFDTTERLKEYAGTLLKSHAPEDLVIVTSGAVALGARRLFERERSLNHYTDQQKAQLGATGVFMAWELAFRHHDVYAGGLQVTHAELDDKIEGGSLLTLLEANRSQGIVSIINRNDALSNGEKSKKDTGGDNDGLARHIGEIIGATELHLYTKRGGIVDDKDIIIKTITPENWQSVRDMLESRKQRPGSNGRGWILSKDWNAARFSRTTGTAFIAPPPTTNQDRSLITEYPRAA